ncbi:hypothetical protein jhhlp_002889 [Lomentospora prolificans]|uniref:Ubiquitin 3 binding protein But2 C-terminal domain-containing protein n=1 Tax=Lomentospora prolificans TaxID=41688 RepID=A0A2N3NFC3_9PEZI|nr:hypothetical protein jhhlp_002889 [Lomentospora prolificans]
MPSFSTALTSFACLMAVATAMPATNVARQLDTDCSPGTSYFQCGDYDGCYAKDPCVAAPDPTHGQCPEGSAVAEVLPKALYNIFPEHADLAKDAVTGVHLETYSDKSQIEQVVAFTGIPSSAKSCSFNWRQGERIERAFVINGQSGLAGVTRLSGFPAEGEDVSYNSIKEFAEAGTDLGGVDFTNWDSVEGATAHTAGNVDCAENMYFKLHLRDAKGNTKLYLGQDQDNGLYVTYTC